MLITGLRANLNRVIAIVLRRSTFLIFLISSVVEAPENITNHIITLSNDIYRSKVGINYFRQGKTVCKSLA